MIILVAFLILMCVSGATNGSEVNCIPAIKVPRNTVFLAPVMTMLKINCTITLNGCHRRPSVSWCKLYGNGCKFLNYSDRIITAWKNITEHDVMAFLIFLDISMEDAGFYRCKGGDLSIGHAINVTVTGDLNSVAIQGDLQWLWYFVYISSGIVGLLFIVMTVSLLYAIRCQGRKSTRKDMVNKDQYMDTQKKDLLLPPHLYLDSDLLTYVEYRV